MVECWKIYHTLAKHHHVWLFRGVAARRILPPESCPTQEVYLTPRTVFLVAFEKLKIVTINSVMYVCPSALNNSAPTGRIFMKFEIYVFLVICQKQFKFYWNLTRITSTLLDDQSKSFLISHWILLRKRNVSDKFVEKIKTHFMFRNFFFPKIVPFMRYVEKCGRLRLKCDGTRTETRFRLSGKRTSPFNP